MACYPPLRTWKKSSFISAFINNDRAIRIVSNNREIAVFNFSLFALCQICNRCPISLNFSNMNVVFLDQFNQCIST